MGNVRQLLGLGIAMVVASPVGGIIGAAGATLDGGPFAEIFLRWSLADFVGFLVFSPLILTLPAWRAWFHSAPAAYKIESTLSLLVLLVVSLSVYGPAEIWSSGLEGTYFLPFPILLWIALRSGPQGTAVAALIVSVTALSFAINGHGPFSGLEPIENVESLQFFITSLVLSTATVAALTKERDVALAGLTRSLDILETRVKERTQALKDSEGRYRAHVESAPVCILEIDLDRRLTSVNAAGLRMLEADTVSEVLGLDILSIPLPKDRDRIAGLFNAALNGTASYYDFELVSKTGTFHYASSFAPIEDDSGRISKVMGISQDITERKSLEAKFIQSQKMEAIGQLTGGVAHDFNNLLAVMIGCTESLAALVNGDAALQKELGALMHSIDHATTLTDRLLAFSRQQQLMPRPTNISVHISGVEDLLRRSMSEDVSLDVRLQDNLWPALIDPAQLEHALVNLAVNARDAMAGGGTITIEATNETMSQGEVPEWEIMRPGDYIRVSVTDTGSGMDPKIREKAFEPFFTTKEIGDGSGLGLSMVYGFAKQSKGHVAIDSEVGRGTSVRLYLPRSEESVEYIAPLDTPKVLPKGTERILVVEDNDDVRRLTVTILSSHGYDVTETGSAAGAIQLLEEGEVFDLLFTDIGLPGGMNGIALGENIKDLQPSLRVLYTTGYVGEISNRDVRFDPGDKLVTKPFRRKVLLEKVRQVLDMAEA